MFRTVPLSIIRSFSLYTQQWYMILLASCQQTSMTYTIAVCTVKTPDDGQRNCPKHVEFYFKNKFEKLVVATPDIYCTRHYCVRLAHYMVLSRVGQSKQGRR